jgi:hypothetical protein
MKLTCGDPSDATDPTQFSRGYIGTKVFGATVYIPVYIIDCKTWLGLAAGSHEPPDYVETHLVASGKYRNPPFSSATWPTPGHGK